MLGRLFCRSFRRLIVSLLSAAFLLQHGFNPAEEHFRKKGSNVKSGDGAQNDNDRHDNHLIAKAKDVFTRVPTLWALFCEILACQGLSTLLNVCCVTKVSEAIPNDTERAGWMGKVRSFWGEV